ncbi:MAG: hypothetical protein HGA30_01715, partial [Anaerolineales bacterium]|nr:hypothetical protein [Anaerolineales bacterium]
PREFTFSLSHAPVDRPIATLVRRALRRQKFTEVEESPAQIRLLVLTQNVTRLELQSFLEEDGHRVAILADNLDMHSDPLLEAVIRQQVVDFRDGSPAVLKALARTLGDPSAANLPLGFETTPKPLNALILPRGIRENAMLVRSAGAYLLFAGLGGLLLSVLGLPNTPLVGFVSVLLGLCLLNAGRRIWQRRILRLLFVPVYALSLWLHITIIFTTFFNSFAQPTPQDWTGWILTLERLASFEDWTCFLPFTLLSTLATTVPLYNSTMKNWLPALGQSRRKDGLFMLLRSPLPARWSRASWLIGAFYAFGMPILVRLMILFFTEAFSL